MNPILATAELLLVLPASIFMAALFGRSIQPVQYQPAHLAQQIVDWYSARPHTGLWLFLMALPLAALALGAVSLRRAWTTDPELRKAVVTLRSQLPAFVIVSAMVASGLILAVVALHVMTD